MLEKLVGDLCARNHRTDRKGLLDIEKDIPNQEGFTCVFLSNHHHHRRFFRVDVTSLFNHVDVKLPQLKVHITELHVYISILIDETLNNGKRPPDD